MLPCTRAARRSRSASAYWPARASPPGGAPWPALPRPPAPPPPAGRSQPRRGPAARRAWPPSSSASWPPWPHRHLTTPVRAPRRQGAAHAHRHRAVQGDRRPPVPAGAVVCPPVIAQAGHPQHRVRHAPVRPARQGDRAGLGRGPDHRDRHRPGPLRRLAPPTGKDSSTWSPRCPSAGPGSCSAWNAPGWPATPPTGTSYSSCAA